MAKISRDIVLNACNQGIINAHEAHKNLTGGLWLSWAPEYFITTFIALELKKCCGNEKVFIEHSTKEMLKNAKAFGSGKMHPDVRADGRVDLFLTWAGGTL